MSLFTKITKYQDTLAEDPKVLFPTLRHGPRRITSANPRITGRTSRSSSGRAAEQRAESSPEGQAQRRPFPRDKPEPPLRLCRCRGKISQALPAPTAPTYWAPLDATSSAGSGSCQKHSAKATRNTRPAERPSCSGAGLSARAWSSQTQHPKKGRSKHRGADRSGSPGNKGSATLRLSDAGSRSPRGSPAPSSRFLRRRRRCSSGGPPFKLGGPGTAGAAAKAAGCGGAPATKAQEVAKHSRPSLVSASAAEVPRAGQNLALPHPPPRPRTLCTHAVCGSVPNAGSPHRSGAALTGEPATERKKREAQGSATACGAAVRCRGACTGHLLLILVLAVCHKSMLAHCPLFPFGHPTMPDPSELDEEAFAWRFVHSTLQSL